MNENPSHVNINDPIMGPFMIASSEGHAMHLVGLDRIERFLSNRGDCRTGDAVRALVSEMAHRTWRDARAMACDFPTASFEALPSVAFHLTPCAVVVDCVIDFPTGTVVIDTCRPEACNGIVQCKSARETAA